MYFGVSNFHRAISMVIPRSRSALSLSSTQAAMTPRLDCMRGKGRLDVLTILERALAELVLHVVVLVQATGGWPAGHIAVDET